MSQIEINRIIKQDPAKIWSILSDFGGIHRFHSKVERSPITNGLNSGLGAKRQYVLYDGSTVDEVVSGYREREWLEVTITKAPMPLYDIVVAFHISETPEGHALVAVQVDYTPKFGTFGKLMNAVVIRKKFTLLFEELLDGLSLHAATGVVIGKGGTQAAKQSICASA